MGAPGTTSGPSTRRWRYSGPRMSLLAGKILEVVGMLTVGVALLVYGLGEDDMNAELLWLLVGSVLFLAGYALERRNEGRG